MSINTTLAGLSQNQALNGPDGTVDLPSSLDDAIRYALSFTAMLRDGVGFTAGAIVAGLGYTPVQQGTGTSQLANAVKIGWSAANKLRVQIDSSDYGSGWPIDILGNAVSATSASNANTVGGLAPASFMQRGSINAFTCAWTGTRLIFGVDGNTFSNVMPMDITGNAATATTAGSCTGNAATASTAAACSGNAATASNASALGGIGAGGFVQVGGSLTSLGNSGLTQVTAQIAGTGVFWSASISDARLKQDIAPTAEDSLAKIDRMRFVGYRFKRLPGAVQIDDGRFHRIGGLAQDWEQIDDQWVSELPDDLEGIGGLQHKQPNLHPMLMDAMHAIQQLSMKVKVLESRA